MGEIDDALTACMVTARHLALAASTLEFGPYDPNLSPVFLCDFFGPCVRARCPTRDNHGSFGQLRDQTINRLSVGPAARANYCDVHHLRKS